MIVKLTKPLGETSTVVSETPGGGTASSIVESERIAPNSGVVETIQSAAEQAPAEGVISEGQPTEEIVTKESGKKEGDEESMAPVPYHRFAEVIAERNTLRDKIGKIEKSPPEMNKPQLNEEQITQLNERMRDLMYENPIKFFSEIAPALMQGTLSQTVKEASSVANRQASINTFAKDHPDFQELEGKMAELAPYVGAMAVNADGSINMKGLDRMYNIAKAGSIEGYEQKLREEGKKAALSNISEGDKIFTESGTGRPAGMAKSMEDMTVEELEKILPKAPPKY